MRNDFKKAAETLFSKDNIHIYIHAKPDGDTLGSGVALFLLLRTLGKKAIIVSNDVIPARLSFLSRLAGEQNFCYGAEELKTKGFQNSFTVSVDVASDVLFKGAYGTCEESIQLAIDHHFINTLSCDELYVVADASSTGEIIYSFAKEAEERFGIEVFQKEITNAIYAAISSDTGCFKYGNTTENTHAVAAKLMRYGADAEEINRLLFDTKTKQQLEVERIALTNMEFYAAGKIALTHLTLKELDQIGATYDDAETVAQLPRQIEGVVIGIYMREKKPVENQPETYKFSVRANNNTDMAALCALFGGGGHKKAAGCVIAGKFEEARDRFLNEARKALQLSENKE